MCWLSITCWLKYDGGMGTVGRGIPKGDRRVRRTHGALQQTLIELIREQDLSEISVADVAERAGVNRSTFYDHYRDVHELAEAACTTMIDELIQSLPSLGPDTADEVKDGSQSLLAFFTNFADYAALYRCLLGPQGSARVIDHVRRRLTAAVHFAARRAAARDGAVSVDGPSMEMPHDAPAAFSAGALMGVAVDWLQRGCPRTPAEMATLTWPLLTAYDHVQDGARRNGA
jgi:AcrR family transcriptional regulator